MKAKGIRTTVLGVALIVGMTLAGEPPMTWADEGVVVDVEGVVETWVAEEVDGSATEHTQVLTEEGAGVVIADPEIAESLKVGATVSLQATVPAKIVRKAGVAAAPGGESVDANSSVGQALLTAAAHSGAELQVTEPEVVEEPPPAFPPTGPIPTQWWTHEVYVVFAVPFGQSTNWITKAQVQAHIDDMARLYREQLGYQFTILWNQNNYWTVQTEWSCRQNMIYNLWADAVNATGYDTSFFTERRHLIVMEALPLCYAAGVEVNGSNGIATYGSDDVSLNNGGRLDIRLWAPDQLDTGMFAHEFGHNLGWMHANRQECKQKNSNLVTWDQSNSGECRIIEYGDSSNLMGAHTYVPTLSTTLKYQIGVLKMGEGLREVTTSGSGTVTLDRLPIQGGAGLQGIVFPDGSGRDDPLAGMNYFFEYRYMWGEPEGIAVMRLDRDEQHVASILSQPADNDDWGDGYNIYPEYMQVGDTFRSGSGDLTVTVLSIDHDHAQLSYSYTAPPDDCAHNTTTTCSFSSNQASGQIQFYEDRDWFKFTVPTTGEWFVEATVGGTLTGGLLWGRIFDSNGELVAAGGYRYVDATDRLATVVATHLEAGQQYYYSAESGLAGYAVFPYTLQLKTDDCGGWELENSCMVAVGTTRIDGRFEFYWDADIYTLTPAVGGQYTFTIQSSYPVLAVLYDEEINYLVDAQTPAGGGTASLSYGLQAGKIYQLGMFQAEGIRNAPYTVLISYPTSGGVAPQGNLNNIEPRPGGIWVRGWAADADVPSNPIQVKVSVGGVLGASGAEQFTLTANLQRTDIPRTYPQFGEWHGFNETLATTKRGTQTVYVYAIDFPGTGGANKLIATRTVTIPGTDPQGNLNNIETRSGGIWVRGWAADADAPTTPIQVKVSIGGVLGASGAQQFTLNANLQRTDLPRTYPQFGEMHGFNQTLTTTKRGTQLVYVYAVNASGTGGANKLIATRTVNIGVDPQGNVNNIEARPGGIWVRGWAADADAPTTPIQVKVSIGGVLGASGAQQFTLNANLQRTDIPRTYPAFGEMHGFNQTLTTTKRGTQQVYFYAVNANGTPGADKLLATRTITIPNPT
jgi:hypothetical protein